MKATGKVKKKSTVTLKMSQEEAAYLHAFLGEFSPIEFKKTVKTALNGDDGTCFLPIEFDVDGFHERLSNGNSSYYYTLDKALQDIHDAR